MVNIPMKFSRVAAAFDEVVRAGRACDSSGVALICSFILYRLLKPFFNDDDSLMDLDTSNASALFSVAKRLEKLYRGSRVYVGLQIPDPDSASRQNIDLVLVADEKAVVISVKNVSGFISADKDGNWVCTSGTHSKTELIPNPVVILGLDAAGKTTILYKLHIREVLSTVPTISIPF